MKQNRLFERSRWRLASWYAAILSIILLICALGVYEAVAHAHRITINQELESVAGTLHDSLLPVLKQPGKLEPEVKDLLPDTCLVETGCYDPDPRLMKISQIAEKFTHSFYVAFEAAKRVVRLENIDCPKKSLSH